jgi:hypothetical protein
MVNDWLIGAGFWRAPRKASIFSEGAVQADPNGWEMPLAHLSAE